MSEQHRIELADDVSTVSESECVIDVLMHVGDMGIVLTIRAKVDRESDVITWTPERVLCASWDDGTEIVVDNSFCSAAQEAILREHHDAAIEGFARDWMEREDLSAERDRFLEAGLRMIGGFDV